MSSKPVWHNDVERDAWVEKNCRVCFQPDEARKRVMGTEPGCPHLARSEQNKLPTPWTKRRNAVYGETYRCSEFSDKPPTNRRKDAPADTVPMFDDIPEDVDFIPVEGWPSAADFGRKVKNDKGDHQ